MAKRFKFRISRVFQSCRSKDPSTLPSNPVPSFLSLSLTPPKPHHRSSLRRHVSSAFISIGCGFRSGSTLSVDHHNQPHDFHWEQQDKWHVVAKVYAPDHTTTPRRKIYSSSADDDDDDDVFPLPPPRVTCDRKKKRRARKKKTTPRFRMSTSSADSCGLFSSDGCDDEEETETLVSTSKSFSTECSSLELNPHLETICETPSQDREGVTKKKKRKQKKKKKKKKKRGRRSISLSPESVSPARLSMLLRLMPWKVEGKVRESFAVVKRSEDPYEDFRRSMMEMIMEKQIFEESDLEQLLHCFLSLNSTQYHGLIVQAFTEIWEALFTTTLTKL